MDILRWFTRKFGSRADNIHLLLAEEGVSDHDKFMEWAFGEGYMTAPLTTLKHKWNNRHFDLFIVYGTDRVDDSMRRMARAYIKSTSTPSTFSA